MLSYWLDSCKVWFALFTVLFFFGMFISSPVFKILSGWSRAGVDIDVVLSDILVELFKCFMSGSQAYVACFEVIVWCSERLRGKANSASFMDDVAAAIRDLSGKTLWALATLPHAHSFSGPPCIFLHF